MVDSTPVTGTQTLDFGAHNLESQENNIKIKRTMNKAKTQPKKGLHIPRLRTQSSKHPFDQIQWTTRSAVIKDAEGRCVFEQHDVEVPAAWSQLATNVVVSKYFRGTPNTAERETSVKQLILRVVDTIGDWAQQGKYFITQEDLYAFKDELSYLLVHQHAAFNSPVWFNVGVEPQAQCSACFINSVEDTMPSIMDLVKTEGMLFKHGSGTGTNFSTLRGKNEHLAGGGIASGPVSFMKGFDSFAGVIKSGGKTRRAAKMVILDVDHPDIEEFIESKAKEEAKAWALIDAGYDGSFDGEAYASIQFQNANHSVRVSDQFMQAVENDEDWDTINRVDGSTSGTFKARDLLQKISEAAYQCGDPGMQFDSQINKWHTCKSTDRIYASNPCSEYMFLNDSACNLASLNLMKFRDEQGHFDTQGFKHAIDVVLTAQEILVDSASYPTPRIKKNSHHFRPLGLGYANLGALLMARGLAYDSDTGRHYAAGITALMCGEAYAQSARLAQHKGAFEGYSHNSESMLDVMQMHRDALDSVVEDEKDVSVPLMDAARQAWDDALSLGRQHGYRNAQATVLAPTGTIGFMMDCDTTGIEPDISLIKYKKLVGGGMLKLVNQTVPEALERLGYSGKSQSSILEYLEQEETIEGAPGLDDAHLAIFDCAFKPFKGVRTISPLGHIRMMGAVQPFLSGAISKTVNIPTEATVEDISDIYMESWKGGLKAVALYRDGCKRSQPLNTSKDSKSVKSNTQKTQEPWPVRRRLADERQALTHKFSIAGHEGYITAGLYDDGMPGEIFITMSKEGSTISGLMDSLATAISMALQYGVPLGELCRKFSHTRYEPSGFTGNKEIPIAKSITDYLFRWLALRFIDKTKESKAPVDLSSAVLGKTEVSVREQEGLSHHEMNVFKAQADAPGCSDCGSIMVRNGACYKCLNCGSTSGCS
jgi:ribonucleoside-diphosphate reductase alpha chain